MDIQQARNILRASGDLKQEFSVRSFRLFGSITRGELGAESDIDILVEFEPDARIGLIEFVRLQRRLSDLLGRNVDLATPDALHKRMRQRILSEAIHAS